MIITCESRNFGRISRIANKILLVVNGKILSNIEVGGSGVVSHYKDELLAGKLMAMGILPGSRVQLIRKAPIGGGCYVKVDNLLIALRQSEAANIVLK